MEEALRALNRLKQRRRVRDYAVMGGYAAANYMEPMVTEDADVLILVESDEEFYQAYQEISHIADRIEGMHHVIAETPVQLFPTTVSPLYADAMKEAVPVRIDNVRTKVVAAEHLILMFLTAFRSKDRIRILDILKVADKEKLGRLLQRFDDEERTLTQRLESVYGGGHSGEERS